MFFSNRATNIIATGLLIFVFLITVFSMKDDSLTMDELAHLPAGYSYLTQKDMRLNPEHPPLIKDLAAIPLLFIKNIYFPSESKTWKEDINGQWDFGREFLYNSGNPAEKIIFWGRLPMILILLLLGFYVFKWARELWGNKAALLALFLFSFSPALLAHGRLVTTDVGAALGIVIATYYFLKSLKSPSFKNTITAGIFFGVALLLKFSTILLVPFFGVLILVWWLTKMAKFWKTAQVCFFVFLIGLILIWPVYLFHTWNYPLEKQASDTQYYLQNTADFVKKPILFMAESPVLRPYGHYFTGLSMIFQRVAGGNTTYFLGQVNNQGWLSYFPIVYLVKETLPFHILTLIAFLAGLWLLIKKRFNLLKARFAEFAMVLFIGIYWIVSIKGNLNIGIRHLLPVFPFIILLVSAGIIKLLKEPYLKINPVRDLSLSGVKYGILAALIIWQIISVISVYPSFLAYFNELAGGPDNGYKYAADSNLDWGQDLKRLAKWLEENNINKIYLDYFGGSEAQYYLKEKYAPWRGGRDPKEFPKGSYLAISATFLQGGRGLPAPGFTQPTGYYLWLDKYQPIAKIGYSIFVYYIPSPP